MDCVLLFEGERERSYRTLRALKNRFGATSEVGVFEMRSGGLVEVADPSARFVGEASDAPGSCVLCAMEGTRPLLVEVQALVAPTEIVPPRRVATGIDRNRLAMVLAVLARHGGPSLAVGRRLRERRRRGAGGRAGRRPGGGAGAGVGAPRRDARRSRRAPARMLRRGRAHGRAALRRATPSGASPRRSSSASAPCSARRPAEPVEGLAAHRTLRSRCGDGARAGRPGQGRRRSPACGPGRPDRGLTSPIRPVHTEFGWSRAS